MRLAFKALGVALAVVAVLALTVNEFTPSASGPTSSSYSTAADGLAGYADLLAHSGYPVTRERIPLARAALDPGQTVVMLDPSLVQPGDVTALRAFLSGGGRLVAGGRDPGAWLSELLADPPDWSQRAPVTYVPLIPLPEVTGIAEVQSAGAGTWSDPRATLPALGGPGATLLTVATLGRGRIELLADSSPLQNQLLAQADNAALGLAIAGPRGRPVVFEEGVHGYGQQSGLAALPTRWKWTLIGLLIAALVAVAAYIRRLGPPEPAAAGTQPPRLAHVEALASALARTRQPGPAAKTVGDHARAIVLKRAGLPRDAGAESFTAAARRFGLDQDEVRALAGAPEDLHAAGRALAKLDRVGL